MGLIVPDITNPFFPELIQGFEEIAVSHGYEMLVSSTNEDPQRVAICVRRMLERKAEAVAVMTFGIEEPLLEQLAQRNIPLAFIDIGPKNTNVNLLHIDYRQGIQEAVQHLVALGHSHIAFIRGPKGLHSADSRFLAFQAAMKRCKLTIRKSLLMQGDHTLEGGMHAMEQLWSLGRKPTAVLCSNDLTAIGVMHKAYRAGVCIPKELSIVGFDDIHMSEVTIPPLTTVRMSRQELAEAAFQALSAQAEQHAPAQKIIIKTSLTVRESTAVPSR